MHITEYVQSPISGISFGVILSLTDLVQPFTSKALPKMMFQNTSLMHTKLKIQEKRSEQL